MYHTQGGAKDPQEAAGIWEGPHQGAPRSLAVGGPPTNNPGEAPARAEALLLLPPGPGMEG